MISSKSRD